MSSCDEAAFESAIEIYLIEHDKYIKRDHTQFDRKLCIDTEIFCAFVKQSQPKEWKYLEQSHREKTLGCLINDFTRALDSGYEGCLSVLRHGFKCYGKKIHGAYFKPVSGMHTGEMINSTSIVQDLEVLALKTMSCGVILEITVPVTPLIQADQDGSSFLSGCSAFRDAA